MWKQTAREKLCWNKSRAAGSITVWRPWLLQESKIFLWLISACRWGSGSYLGIGCYLQTSPHSGIRKRGVPAGKSPKPVFGTAVCWALSPYSAVRFVLYMPISVEATLIPDKMVIKNCTPLKLSPSGWWSLVVSPESQPASEEAFSYFLLFPGAISS